MGEAAAGLRLHSLVCDGSEVGGLHNQKKKRNLKKKKNSKKEKGKGKREKKSRTTVQPGARHGMPRWDAAQVEQHRKSWLL